MSNVIGSAVIEVVSDATKLKVGIEEAKKSVKSLGGEIGKSLSDGSEKASRSIDAYIKKIQFSADTIGKTTREIKLMELAQRGANEAQLQAANAALSTIEAYKSQQREQLKAADASRNAAAIVAAAQGKQVAATKLTSYQTQQLSYQLNDLFVQIASGQSPLTALIQQGSQLNGTFGGVGGTLKAVGSLFTAARVAIGGTAVALATLGYAAYQGSKESSAYAKSLILSGNAAGLTVGQLQQMAEAVGKVTGSQHEAAAALAEFAANSNISADNISRFATVAIRIQKETDQAIGDTIKKFVELGKDPVAASLKLNETTHFLTVEIYKQIKALDEQGKRSEAATLAQNTYANVMNKRMNELEGQLGSIERWWREVGISADKAWNFMLGLGRPTTNFEKIKEALIERDGLEEQLQSSEKWGDKKRSDYLRRQLDANKEIINGLRRQGDASRFNAEKAKEAADQLSSQVKLESYLGNTQYADNKTRKALEIKKENAEFAAAVVGFDKNSKQYEAAFARHKTNLAKIAEQYKGAKTLDLSRPTLNFDLDAIRNNLESMTNAYINAEKILEVRRSAGLISEKEYYEAKKEFIALTEQAQINALQNENSRISAQAVNAKEKIENDKKIADNIAKIAKLRENASTNIVVLNEQEAASAEKIKRAYEDARVSAQDYIDAIQRQNQREADGVGKGTRFREIQSGRSQIDDRFKSGKQALDKDLRNNAITQEQYDTYVSIAEEAYAKEVAAYEKRTAMLDQKRGDWINGATESLQNYLDQSKDISAQIGDLFTNAFKGMEDALTDFVTTGKLNFKDLANSIVADISRMIIKQQITAPLASLIQGGISSGGGLGGLISTAFGSLFGGGAAAGPVSDMPDFMRGGRAIGGPVSAGGLYRVNERGPELLQVAGRQYLMMGNQSGSVSPNNTNNNSSINQTINFVNNGPVDRRTQTQVGLQAMRGLQMAARRNG